MRSSQENQMIKSTHTGWISRVMVACLFGCAFILTTGAAWADRESHSYGHDPKSHLEHLTKKLNLTQKQQANVLPIIEEKHKKMEALRVQMKEVRQQAMSQIEAQLTPEQQEQFRKAKEEHHKKMKECKGKHGKDKGYKKGKHGMGEHHD